MDIVQQFDLFNIFSMTLVRYPLFSRAFSTPPLLGLSMVVEDECMEGGARESTDASGGIA